MPKTPMWEAGRKLLAFASPNEPVREDPANGASEPRTPDELMVGGRRYRLVPVDAEEPDHGAVRAAEILTPRELQIVVLVADGCVNKQIADVLRISEWTVSTHLRRIFAKLGVDTRAAMVSRCYGALLGPRKPTA
jgi:DNA-binding CsgD family transcriptional regulator